MSILWYLPPLVVLIWILYYNYSVKRTISRPSEFLRLLIAVVIALAALGVFLWVTFAGLDCAVRTVMAATLGGSITFLIKDPGSTLRNI